MENENNLVIVDAANILRDDRGCIIRDENQNRLVQMRPERLQMVIKHIRNAGGKPVCILRNGTYHSGKKRKDSDDPRFGDWNLVEAGIESGDIIRVSDDDDMYCVTLALQTDSLLLSRDQFRPEQKKYPHYEWAHVSKLRIDDYNFIAGQFVSPELDRAMVEKFPEKDTTNTKASSSVNASKSKSKENEAKNSTYQEKETKSIPTSKQNKPKSKKGRKSTLNDEELGTIHEVPEPPKPTSLEQMAGKIETDEEVMIILDELYASLYSLTADDGQCNQAMVLEMLAREFLGKIGHSSEWKKGWVRDLKSYIKAVTGSDQRPIKWVRENLPDAFSYSNPYIVRK